MDIEEQRGLRSMTGLFKINELREIKRWIARFLLTFDFFNSISYPWHVLTSHPECSPFPWNGMSEVVCKAECQKWCAKRNVHTSQSIRFHAFILASLTSSIQDTRVEICQFASITLGIKQTPTLHNTKYKTR